MLCKLNWTRRSTVALFSLAFLALAGCGGGGDGAKVFTVTGTATLDSQPIPDGQITFREAKGGRRFVGPIKNGAYEVKAEAGDMLVEIIATRVVPGKFDTTTNPGMSEPVSEMYVPKKYNSETTLTVKIEGNATLPPFELKSK